MNKVMVFAVHPDDETLGCGGTILKHKKKGDCVSWCIITEKLHEKGFTEEEIDKRNEEISNVSKGFSFDTIYKLGFPTTCLDKYSKNELISSISKSINDFKPDILYIPFKNDVHSDHRVSFESVFSCTKIFRYPFIKKIYMMEVLSETEFAPGIPAESFVPNYYVDISEFFSKKIEILKIFKNEIDIHPFPRSLKNVEALATFRGSAANCDYAESFMLLKEIN
jgi:LmbE family N-acetylglucosaminyl deacetylase